ncbi:hypothetical protein ElyMa_004366500 [Elysia marginata]|uniref:Uncharacterized protein n=1 Tax=Elysia marginata TaxID=1093978 RepID=A0AAV4H7A9_9GAST|nr:hypothetical protein ElyMa_004366500 [Elysia marginata]
MPEYYILCIGNRIKEVCTFEYLSFTTYPDTRYGIQIQKRITLLKDTFTEIKSIFINRNITLRIKTNTLVAYVMPLVLFCTYVNVERCQKTAKEDLKQQKCGISEET